MKLLYLNIKPQKADEENPDNWKHIEDLGMSVAATYTAATRSFNVYEEKEVNTLIRSVELSDLVITYAGNNFDFRILNGYINYDLTEKVRSFKILENVEGDLWQRLSLANLARQNLNRYQTTNVSHQIELYKRNMMRTLRDCVRYDIESIVKIFRLGCERKFLNYWCPDEWTQKSFRTDSWAKTCRQLTFVARNYRG